MDAERRELIRREASRTRRRELAVQTLIEAQARLGERIAVLERSAQTGRKRGRPRRKTI